MAKAEYRSAIRSRRLIIDALADILQEKPLDKITVTELVNRAGINRGTFYAHYADIPDVVQHLIQDTFLKIREVIDRETGQLQRLPEMLMGQIREILAADLEFYQKVMNSSTASVMQQQLVGFVIDYLLEHESAYPMNDHRQYELTIRFCAGGLSNLYMDWFGGKLDMTLDELTASAAQMLQSVLDRK
jgi:AcrR family transcriptional regulator